MIRSFSLALALGLVCTAPAHAADIKVTPGQWTAKGELLIGGQPSDVKNKTYCVNETDSTLSQERLIKSVEEEGCSLSNLTITGDKVSGDMSCRVAALQMNAQGKFSGDYDAKRFAAKAKGVIDFGGLKVPVDLNVSGEHLGACSPQN